MTSSMDSSQAELFKTMGHPVRVRILGLLQDRDLAVADLLAAVGAEPALVTQQLGVLRRGGLVTSRRDGTTVMYELADKRLGEVLDLARDVLLQQSTTPNQIITG